MNYKEIGLRIKYLRQIQRTSQKALAEKIGVTTEMISRYETGKNSPMKKLDSLADALNVNVSSLLQQNVLNDNASASYHQNLIPYISSRFDSLNAALESAKQFYTAPEWIVKTCARPFASDTSIFEIKTAQIENNGIVLATQEPPTSDNDLIIKISEGKLTISNARSLTKGEKAIATIVAWEKRFR